MLPYLLALARTYAPAVVLPFAAVVGFVGYNLESLVGPFRVVILARIAQLFS